MTLRANERGQIQKSQSRTLATVRISATRSTSKPVKMIMVRKSPHLADSCRRACFQLGASPLGGQTRAKRREQARHAGEDLLGISGTVEVPLRTANQANEKSLACDKKEKSRERRERAQAKGKEKIAEMAGITELAVGSTQATGAEELFVCGAG
jgi:hypothetical protein